MSSGPSEGTARFWIKREVHATTPLHERAAIGITQRLRGYEVRRNAISALHKILSAHWSESCHDALAEIELLDPVWIRTKASGFCTNATPGTAPILVGKSQS